MIRALVGVAVFILGLHVAYIFLSPSIKNTMLEGKMQEVAKNRTLRRELDVRREMTAFIAEKKIPLLAEDLHITVDEKGTSIAAHYSDHVEFWFYERDYEFYPASSDAARLRARPAPRPSGSRRAVRAGH